MKESDITRAADIKRGLESARKKREALNTPKKGQYRNMNIYCTTADGGNRIVELTLEISEKTIEVIAILLKADVDTYIKSLENELDEM